MIIHTMKSNNSGKKSPQSSSKVSVTWKDEGDIYNHLLDSLNAQHNLLYCADIIHHHCDKFVNVEHNLLKVPLTLTSGMMDVQLVASPFSALPHHSLHHFITTLQTIGVTVHNEAMSSCFY